MKSNFLLRPGEIIFPHPLSADPDGLVAILGDITPERLILAYQFGIFPWFNPGDTPMWFCPLPRFCLNPRQVKVHKSMRSYFNNNKFRVTFDQCFTDVMEACKNVTRNNQSGGSWISDQFIESYSILNRRGLALSVEVWKEDVLVGGLYGVKIGRIFFGESMFSTMPNASKYGFITLCRKLVEDDFVMIDCQQESNFLRSLGAQFMDGPTFLQMLRANRLYYLSLQRVDL